MRVLELYCGTKSVGKVWEKYGWEVVSVDIVPKRKPTILVDVLEWNFREAFPTGHFDVIWSSPPCTTFSILQYSNIGRKMSDGRIKTHQIIEDNIENIGIPLLRKTEEIIQYFNPRFWFMENPQTGRMKQYTIFPNFTDVSYCSYGFPYRKKTRIWSNTDYKGVCCKCPKHEGTVQDVSLLNRYSIPPMLIDSIGEYIKYEMSQNT